MHRHRTLSTLLATGILVTATLVAALFAQAGTQGPTGSEPSRPGIRGAGTTMLEGGTGPPSFTPVLTKIAFHWGGRSGRFECLALAPSAEAGAPRSGNFNTNVMYVTGEVTSATIHGGTAVLEGSATVTGLGAGSNEPFTATLTRGGPGATLTLEVSGLTFDEILLEGRFTF